MCCQPNEALNLQEILSQIEEKYQEFLKSGVRSRSQYKRLTEIQTELNTLWSHWYNVQDRMFTVLHQWFIPVIPDVPPSPTYVPGPDEVPILPVYPAGKKFFIFEGFLVLFFDLRGNLL
jgi:hypothetical protein